MQYVYSQFSTFFVPDLDWKEIDTDRMECGCEVNPEADAVLERWIYGDTEIFAARRDAVDVLRSCQVGYGCMWSKLSVSRFTVTDKDGENFVDYENYFRIIASGQSLYRAPVTTPTIQQAAPVKESAKNKIFQEMEEAEKKAELEKKSALNKNVPSENKDTSAEPKPAVTTEETKVSKAQEFQTAPADLFSSKKDQKQEPADISKE